MDDMASNVWDIGTELTDNLTDIARMWLRRGHTSERVQQLITQRVALKLNPELLPHALAYAVVHLAEWRSNDHDN